MTPRLNKAAWVVTAIYTALLTTASLLPSGQGLLGGWDASISPNLQNGLHLPAYAGIVILWALSWSTRSPLTTCSILAVTCACVAFGAAMELAQSVIPGRTCSLKDGLVNLVGVILGYIALVAWRRFRPAGPAVCQSGPAAQESARCAER